MLLIIQYSKLLTLPERLKTLKLISQKHGIKGVIKDMENEKIFFKAVLDGKIGYCLYKGIKG
jgi:hypothetical protein